MGFEVGKKFWIAATAVIVVVTLFVVGRNLLHAVKIKRQINALTREQAYYAGKIAQDSTGSGSFTGPGSNRTARCWSACATTTIWRSMPAKTITCSAATSMCTSSRSDFPIRMT